MSLSQGLIAVKRHHDLSDSCKETEVAFFKVSDVQSIINMTGSMVACRCDTVAESATSYR